MSAGQMLEAIFVCTWGGTDGEVKTLKPGETGLVPHEEAEGFKRLGAARLAPGQAAPVTPAVPQGGVIPAEGVEQSAVADAARAALLADCREKDIPVTGEEPAAILQSYLDAHEAAEKAGAEKAAGAGEETGPAAGTGSDDPSRGTEAKDPPAGSGQEGEKVAVRETGIPPVAYSALEKMGVMYVNDLAEHTRDEIDAVKGLGDASMPLLDKALEEAGLAWKDPSGDMF